MISVVVALILVTIHGAPLVPEYEFATEVPPASASPSDESESSSGPRFPPAPPSNTPAPPTDQQNIKTWKEHQIEDEKAEKAEEEKEKEDEKKEKEDEEKDSSNDSAPPSDDSDGERCFPADYDVSTQQAPHNFKCKNIEYSITIPSQCVLGDVKCGLIMDIHGWGMTSKMQEAADYIDKYADNYIYIRPSEADFAHFADWSKSGWEDLKNLENFLREAVKVYDKVLDRNRIHVAGFSQGGFLSYNLLCRASDVICSIAPLGIPCDGIYADGYMAGADLTKQMKGHKNCFYDTNSGGPSIPRSIMHHHGKYDFLFGPSTFKRSVSIVKSLYNIEDEGETVNVGGVDWKRYKKGNIVFETAHYDAKSDSNIPGTEIGIA